MIDNLTMSKAKQIHPAMLRLYDAVVSMRLIGGENRQSAIALLLNVPSQNVKHWENRGPSKEIRLRCQAEFGINATWIETGSNHLSPLKADIEQESPENITAFAHSIGGPDTTALTNPVLPLNQSPLVVAAMRLDRSPLISAETKAAMTQFLQSLLKK